VAVVARWCVSLLGSAGLLLVCLVCASAGVGATSKKATLRVAIHGLPTTMRASVVVRGPHGYRLRLTKSLTKTGLAPGGYAIVAKKVQAGSRIYKPAIASPSLKLVEGKVTSATVAYAAVRTVGAPPARPTAPVTGTAPKTGAVGAVGSSASSSSGGGGSGASNSAGGGTTSTNNGPPTTPTGGAGAQPAGVVFYFGYAYTYGGNGSAHPNPWSDTPGIAFVGCGNNGITDPGRDNCPKDASGNDEYDAGAIRIDNLGTIPVIVTSATVRVGTCLYRPWPGLSMAIQPGATLILTQTGGPSPCGDVTGAYNFDTSESNESGRCTNDNLLPSLTVSLNGQATTVVDTGQILNTDGLDGSECMNKNEFRDWVAAQ